jgi:calreticulin
MQNNLRWVIPTTWKTAAELGQWEHTAGKWYADAADKGIKTSEDARFYGTHKLSSNGKAILI